MGADRGLGVQNVRKGTHAEIETTENSLDRRNPNSHRFRFTRDLLNLDLFNFQEILQHSYRAFVTITFTDKFGTVAN